MQRFSLYFYCLALVAIAATGADIKVATLNCLLLFDPTIDHRGKVDDELRHEPETIALRLDAGGWANVPDLLAGCARHGISLSRERLNEITCHPSSWLHSSSARRKLSSGRSQAGQKEALP